MQFREALSKFPFLLLRLRLKPQETLRLPVQNKGNTLRGAFGTSFRRLVCVPECRNARACPLAESCPYKLIFEPSPPLGSDRLSKNQDIPRPFIFRPPLDARTTYAADEVFEFELVLLGAAVNYLPYFVLAFREVMGSGFGLNRARCELTEVRALPVLGSSLQATGNRLLSPETCPLVYCSTDQVFHQPEVPTLGDYVRERLALFPVPSHLLPLTSTNLSSALPLVTRRSSLVTRHPSLATVLFLTPTYLRADGQLVRQPEFHHLFKRLRDRLNALSTFYGPGPIDAEFKALGSLAEKVKAVRSDVHWVERFRTSSKTHQRHELSGFVGSCIYDFADVACILPSGGGLQAEDQVITEPELHSQEGALDLQSGISNPSVPASLESVTATPNAQKGDLDSQPGISNQPVFSLFLPWLLAGEICHVGKHAAWGNGKCLLQLLPDERGLKSISCEVFRSGLAC